MFYLIFVSRTTKTSKTRQNTTMQITDFLHRSIIMYRDSFDTSRMAKQHRKKYPGSKATRDTFSRAIRNLSASSEIISTIKSYYRAKVRKLNK